MSHIRKSASALELRGTTKASSHDASIQAFELFKQKRLPEEITMKFLKDLYEGRMKSRALPVFTLLLSVGDLLMLFKELSDAFHHLQVDGPKDSTAGTLIPSPEASYDTLKSSVSAVTSRFTMENVRKDVSAFIKYFAIEARNAFVRIYPFADIFVLDFSLEATAESPAISLPDVVLVEGSLIIASMTGDHAPPYYPLSQKCKVIIASRDARERLLTISLERPILLTVI